MLGEAGPDSECSDLGVDVLVRVLKAYPLVTNACVLVLILD